MEWEQGFSATWTGCGDILSALEDQIPPVF